MSKEKFSQLIIDTMSGQNLLPESHVINLVYQELYGLPDRTLLSILGSDWLIAARTPYPRLRGANNLVVPENKLLKQEAKVENPEEEKEEDEEKEKEKEPEPEPTILTYVCRGSGSSSMLYHTGKGMGGSLQDAVRFQTTSQSEASCNGRGAGSTGTEPTSPFFL